MSSVSQLWAYRSLILNLTQRELKARYKKSILGWLWSLINPASVLAIYSFVFGVVFNAKPPVAGNGHTTVYALYLFAGLWVWNYFNGTVMGAITALQTSGPLLNKVYFPPACPAVANTAKLVLFPLLIICISFFSLGVGLALSVYNVFYRDVNYLVTIGMNVLFYATPIIYPISLVEAKSTVAARIIELNPIAQYVAWSRDIFWNLTWPGPWSLIVVPLASIGVFVVGLVLFNRKSRDIAQEL